MSTLQIKKLYFCMLIKNIVLWGTGGDNVDIYDMVAKNIKYYRKEKNITQAQLAELSLYSHEFIRRIESNITPKHFSLDAVYRISIALNINVSKLFEERNNK